MVMNRISSTAGATSTQRMCASKREEAARNRLLPYVSAWAAIARRAYVIFTALPSAAIVFLLVAPGSFRNSA